MKKIIISISVVVVIASIAVVVLFWGSNGGDDKVGGQTTAGLLPVANPTTSTYSAPTGSTLTVGTSKGIVIMNNFYNNAKQISIDHTSVLIEETSAYNITYYVPDGSFNILISETPIPTIQAQAETAFLQVLGVSKSDACKLNVEIAVPYSVDPSYANQDIPLSFCATGGAFQSQ